MNALRDFLSKDAGQARSAAVQNALVQYVPPSMRPRLNALSEFFNPVQAIGSAGASTQAAVQPGISGGERLRHGVSALTDTASVLAPMAGVKAAGASMDDAARAFEEVLIGAGYYDADNAVRAFGADEYGGIKAYHGSPHDFDEFNADQSRVGVGDDAFGRGHYFADQEEAARSFMERARKPQVGGVSIYGSGLSDDAQEEVWRFLQDNSSGSLTDVAQASRAKLAQRSDLPASSVRRYNEIISEIEAMGDVPVSMPGHMYEVDINAKPEDFFDWDAPAPQNPEMSGGDYFRSREDRVGRTAATKELQDAGYVGSTYGVRTRDGTRKDYAVFDENLINIVRKYGIAGAATMLGVSAAEVQAAMQEGESQ